MIEDARARVLDGDTTRRGFGDLHQGLFAVSIDVAMRRGQAVAALELAEQARARALLDLMQDGRAADASQAPPRIAEMQALARELDTTVLVYWVDQASTFAWVVSPDAVRGHRLTIGERALRQLVRVAAGSGNVPGAINAALLGGPDLQAWRALHRAILAPLGADLPARPGARLTIVPHGPLLHLPFAGLLDTRGRYLIERYVLHYTPSLAVLRAATRRAAPPSCPGAPWSWATRRRCRGWRACSCRHRSPTHGRRRDASRADSGKARCCRWEARPPRARCVPRWPTTAGCTWRPTRGWPRKPRPSPISCSPGAPVAPATMGS